MRALRYLGEHQLRLEELPEPVPGPGEVRIRPAAVGICGTDVHILDGSYSSRPPVILGHEVSGYIDAVGPGVLNAREGDLITVEPHRFCGVCRYCRTGREHMCLLKEAYGVQLNGGMAEAQVIPEKIAYKLPDGMDPRVGALTEPLACCVHGMDRLNPRSGLGVLVFGAGPIGLMLIALSRLAGLTPIVSVELSEARRTLAVAMGADCALDPDREDWTEQAQKLTGQAGFDYAIDAVGSPAILTSAIGLAARGAHILIFGVADPSAGATVRSEEIYAKELAILGTAHNPYSHHRAVELLPRLGLDRLPVETFSLEAHEEAFAAQGRRLVGKVQFGPQLSGTR